MTVDLRLAAYEARAVLADIGAADNERSKSPGGPISTRLAHAVNRALYVSGRLANYHYDRPKPQWPMDIGSIGVLGAGQEKIVYQVHTASETEGNLAVGVYHRQSYLNEPGEIIRDKRARYETYKRYFGELITPTIFAVVANPWGEGAKPASIQPLLEDVEPLRKYSISQLQEFARIDPDFLGDVHDLTNGYQRMLADNKCPDLGGDNLVIHNGRIKLFDTGTILYADRFKKIRLAMPGYRVVEQLTEMAGD